jgi:hypothetical protein
MTTKPERCAWCDGLLGEQRWITLWPAPTLEVHCCSEEHLTLWLMANRALRFDTPTLDSAKDGKI